MMRTTYQHLFGPVPSRRLGRSLGVDLTPLKTCTLDCIFCQLGRTTHQTLVRKTYVPTQSVKRELRDWVQSDGQADYITLSGSGEPTLHSGFGEILAYARTLTSIPTVLLSNGTLFADADVRAAAAQADIVKVSLSAWDAATFAYINRPHRGLCLKSIMEGLCAFRAAYAGILWVEVFLLWGINTAQRDVEHIAELVAAIAPDAVHLNTAVRPPAESFAQALPQHRMESLTGLFSPNASVIAEFETENLPDIRANENTILAMLRRRPCTAPEIAAVFGMHPNEVSKYIGKLTRTGSIAPNPTQNGLHYHAVA